MSKKMVLSFFGVLFGIAMLITGGILFFDSLHIFNSSTSRYEQEKQAQIELYGYYDKNKEILTEYKKQPIDFDWEFFVSMPLIVFGGVTATLWVYVLDKELVYE